MQLIYYIYIVENNLQGHKYTAVIPHATPHYKTLNPELFPYPTMTLLHVVSNKIVPYYVSKGIIDWASLVLAIKRK